MPQKNKPGPKKSATVKAAQKENPGYRADKSIAPITASWWNLAESDNPFNHMVDNTIEMARRGDTEAARTILRWFCGAIAANTDEKGKPHRKPSGTGTQINERILRYFGECFQKILDKSHTPDVALGLRKPPHREASRSLAKRNEDMALDMAVKIANGEKYNMANISTAQLWQNHKSFKGKEYQKVMDTIRKEYDKRKDDDLFKLKVKLLKDLLVDFSELSSD